MALFDRDAYFMDFAKVVSRNSPDPDTKHGCVIVDKNCDIISSGYNGTVCGFEATATQLTRPEKYRWLIHAEENAVLIANKSLVGATAYVTGEPCVECFRRFCHVGIRRVVCGDVKSNCMTDETRNFNRQLAALTGVVLESL